MTERNLVESLRRKTRFGSDKLKYLLRLPRHRSTIHRWLKRKSLVKQGVNHRRPRQQPTKHMHVRNALAPGKLQMDVKYVTPQLSGLPQTVYLYAILDIFSRYKVGVMLTGLDQRTAIQALEFLKLLLPYQNYLREYNTERPHLSLNMLTPVEKLQSVQNV